MKRKNNLSSKKILMIFLLLSSLPSNANENFVYVTCEAGRWEGNSIDSEAGGETKFTPNGTSLSKTTYKIPYPPQPFSSDGGKVDITYGAENSYQGIVTYFYNSKLYATVQNDYVIINVSPEQILERHMILIPSGEVHLTYSKIYGGGNYGGADTITTQSFMKKCKVDGYDLLVK
tara:strand:+ start:43 stop:567 length:525 start_codon:yes stop_codon:yes gene_type:complete